MLTIVLNNFDDDIGSNNVLIEFERGQGSENMKQYNQHKSQQKFISVTEHDIIYKTYQ